MFTNYNFIILYTSICFYCYVGVGVDVYMYYCTIYNVTICMYN